MPLLPRVFCALKNKIGKREIEDEWGKGMSFDEIRFKLIWNDDVIMRGLRIRVIIIVFCNNDYCCRGSIKMMECMGIWRKWMLSVLLMLVLW